MLYEHWINNTANALSALQGHRNAFVTELPKIALQYPNMVLQSLLALSGIHYGNRNRNNNVIRQLTYTHLGQALQALKYGLTKHVSGAENNALPLLVTTLIFCFVETVRGDDKGNLRYHLRAARLLLSKVLKSQELRHEESILEFLKEYYAYIAHITDLSTDMDTPSSDPSSFTGAEPLTSDKSSGVLLGCAYKLFEMIPRISTLAREQHELTTYASQSTMDQYKLEEKAHLVVQKRLNLQSHIFAWQPPPNCDNDFELCGRIYQQALLVYNNPPFPSIFSNSASNLSFARQSIDNTISLLNLLPMNAPISATLVWPLAFLGTLAEELHQRHAIRSRLEGIWNILGLGNVKATIDFLDRYWSDEALTDQKEKGCVGGGLRYYQGHLELLMERYGLDISFV
ncbi:hypothetical protein B7463_g8841, partial [Scytalidium lignicola]